ncbi:MAG: hypothetical protein ACPH06_01955 [Flavobacteriaceae bacterium]
MKNIKYIHLFLIALTLVVSSCAVDNDPAVVPMGESVTASLDKTGEILVHEGNDISVNFVLSRTLSKATQFTYTLNGVDNVIDLIQGQQSVSLSIPYNAGDVNTVVLTGAYGLSNEPISLGTTNNSVTFIGVPAVNPNALEVLMSWAGDQNDLDLWITNDPPTTFYELSQTATPIERVSFNNAYPDGAYNILARVWSAVDTNVEVTMYIVHPNGTIELFEDSVPGGVPSAFYYFVKFDKVTDSTTGDIIYTTTKLPAESVF